MVPVNSTSNSIRIKFRSNDQINGMGFKLSWQANCGGVFYATMDEQYISSPGYPKNYENSQYCNYTIKGGGETVNIVWDDFNLEAGKCSEYQIHLNILS